MKYSGRLWLALLSFNATVALNVYVFAQGISSLAFLFISNMWVLVSWQIGKYIDKLNYELDRDALTNAYSRKVAAPIYRKLTRKAVKAKKMVAIFFVDVDHFKMINDRFGHKAGDLLLQKVAVHLSRLPSDPPATVIRWGGDEFVVMVLCQTEEEIAQINRKLLTNMDYVSSQHTVTISISTGYSIFPHHGNELEQLVEFADTQMLWAKRFKKLEQSDRFYLRGERNVR
ncbi:GGDEF domain-containing protein [Paenibacillus sp. 481]|uniref:GGDEF domain-containing protein n=1 Tax=Paenibacillus sp. 481 TaxID=2835869 RepID=UPI001E4E3305|nr:GGDEF domain-containing protein [Paenibacillus sp. 481]UHA73541.1 GGDEF domain-containing protein [Paenibacillus sp. 481]